MHATKALWLALLGLMPTALAAAPAPPGAGVPRVVTIEGYVYLSKGMRQVRMAESLDRVPSPAAAGAEITIVPAGGREITVRTGPDGRFRLGPVVLDGSDDERLDAEWGPACGLRLGAIGALLSPGTQHVLIGLPCGPTGCARPASEASSPSVR